MTDTKMAVASEEDVMIALGEDFTPEEGKDKKPSKKSNKSSSPDNTALDKTKTKTISDLSDEDDNDDEDASTAFDDDDEKKKKVKKVDTVSDDDDDVENDDDNTDDDEDTDADNTDDANDDSEEDDEKKKKVKKAEPSDDDPESVDQDTKDFLKARVDLLIKKGEWADFEGSEDVEWDEDTFADMEIQQRAYQKQQMREDLLDSFGPYGREIAEYTAKGGDPDALIDIFKEQQKVESLSVDTEDQQKEIIKKYETEFLGKKPERVNKYIDSLIADKELKAAAEEAKEAMDAKLAEQVADLKKEQDEEIARVQDQQKQNIVKFSTEVSNVISKSDDIPADEKKQLLSVLTKFDKKLKNGTPVNEFYFKMAEFRKDVKNYVQLARFVLSPEKFTKGLKTDGNNKAVDKAFKLVRQSNSSNKIKSVQPDAGKAATKTKFKLL